MLGGIARWICQDKRKVVKHIKHVFMIFDSGVTWLPVGKYY